MSGMEVQHIGHDIPYEIPEAEAHQNRMRAIEAEYATELLSQFNLLTRILIVEALWGIDVEEVLRQ